MLENFGLGSTIYVAKTVTDQLLGSLFLHMLKAGFLMMWLIFNDIVGVCPHCLDPGTVESVDIEEFDGDNWETHIATTDIKKWSKDEQN